MPPEYAMEGLFSEKSDVYSFGVLLLEIVSGRRNSSFYHSEDSLSLVGFVSLLLNIFITFYDTRSVSNTLSTLIVCLNFVWIPLFYVGHIFYVIHNQRTYINFNR